MVWNIGVAGRAEQDRVLVAQRVEAVLGHHDAMPAVVVAAPVEVLEHELQSAFVGQCLQQPTTGGNDFLADTVAGDGRNAIGLHGLTPAIIDPERQSSHGDRGASPSGAGTVTSGTGVSIMGWFSKSGGNDTFFLATVVPDSDKARIESWLGVVNGEAIIGANIFRDMFSSVRDVVGGRAGGYERALSGARDAALQDMIAAAKEGGANGVVGIDFDYEVLGENNGMMMVSVSGTAVKMAI